MTTYHGLVRTEERTGYKGATANRYIKKAILNGKVSAECTGKLKRYLEQKSNDNAKAIAYDGYCFIMSPGNVLITMYEIPKYIRRKSVYIGKEQIHKPKRYLNHNKFPLFESSFDEWNEEGLL